MSSLARALVLAVTLSGGVPAYAASQLQPEVIAAAENGDVKAQLRLAESYMLGSQGGQQDYQQAYVWLAKAADQGDSGAQYYLGRLSEQGLGVPRDYKQAIAWFRKAADQGNTQAQFRLGWIYEHGQGVPPNYKQSAAWYRKCAEQGDSEAQFNLGVMYDDGTGVPQDDKQAYAWYSVATVNGATLAEAFRNRAAEKLTPAQLNEAQALAARYFDVVV